MDDTLSDRYSYPVPEYSDVFTTFAKFQREGSVQGAARAFMMPPMGWARPWGIDSPTWTVSDEKPWVKPTEDELRAHLLESWPADEVDAYMVQRAQIEADRVARERWAASWRGRIALGYRRSSREVRGRVGEAWRVLRHGIRDEDEY